MSHSPWAKLLLPEKFHFFSVPWDLRASTRRRRASPSGSSFNLKAEIFSSACFSSWWCWWLANVFFPKKNGQIWRVLCRGTHPCGIFKCQIGGLNIFLGDGVPQVHDMFFKHPLEHSQNWPGPCHRLDGSKRCTEYIGYSRYSEHWIWVNGQKKPEMCLKKGNLWRNPASQGSICAANTKPWCKSSVSRSSRANLMHSFFSSQRFLHKHRCLKVGFIHLWGQVILCDKKYSGQWQY